MTYYQAAKSFTLMRSNQVVLGMEGPGTKVPVGPVHAITDFRDTEAVCGTKVGYVSGELFPPAVGQWCKARRHSGRVMTQTRHPGWDGAGTRYDFVGPASRRSATVNCSSSTVRPAPNHAGRV